MTDPIQTFESLKSAYLRYFDSPYDLRFEELVQARRRLLDRDERLADGEGHRAIAGAASEARRVEHDGNRGIQAWIDRNAHATIRRGSALEDRHGSA